MNQNHKEKRIFATDGAPRWLFRRQISQITRNEDKQKKKTLKVKPSLPDGDHGRSPQQLRRIMIISFKI
jgi:hypothetical protein